MKVGVAWLSKYTWLQYTQYTMSTQFPIVGQYHLDAGRPAAKVLAI